MSHLMDVHFPISTNMVLGVGKEDVCFRSFAGAHQTIDYVTLASIQEAISSFGNTKAEGPDGLKPLVLKTLPINCVGRLQAIYIASLFSGYVLEKVKGSFYTQT